VWEASDDALIAWADLEVGRVLLVKPQKYVNNTGKALLRLAQLLGFTSDHCVLVHDDIHLPVGKIRTRMRGSDGGHLGVRSTLVAFQSRDIPRVKVGVACTANQLPPKEYLVSPFPPSVASEMATVYAAAADRLLELVKARRARGEESSAAEVPSH
jgi:PTH1 family peptidyl-tRNA hydrolase